MNRQDQRLPSVPGGQVSRSTALHPLELQRGTLLPPCLAPQTPFHICPRPLVFFFFLSFSLNLFILGRKDKQEGQKENLKQTPRKA